MFNISFTSYENTEPRNFLWRKYIVCYIFNQHIPTPIVSLLFNQLIILSIHAFAKIFVFVCCLIGTYVHPFLFFMRIPYGSERIFFFFSHIFQKNPLLENEDPFKESFQNSGDF